jgi:hypothetical protein
MTTRKAGLAGIIAVAAAAALVVPRAVDLGLAAEEPAPARAEALPPAPPAATPVLDAPRAPNPSPPQPSAPLPNEPPSPADAEKVAGEPFDWLTAGYPSGEAWWSTMREQGRELLAAMPEGARASLAAAAPSFVPVGALNPLDGGRPRSGDFNCDERKDHALVGLDRSTSLGAALAAPADPPAEKLRELYAEYRRYASDEAARVVVGLSAGERFRWVEQAGSTVHNAGRLSDDNVASWQGAAEAGVDVVRAKAQRCDILHIGCCETDGVFYLWNPATQALVGVGGG